MNGCRYSDLFNNAALSHQNFNPLVHVLLTFFTGYLVIMQVSDDL